MTHDENDTQCQIVCPLANVSRCAAAAAAATVTHNKCACAPSKAKAPLAEESFIYTHYEEGGANEIAGGFELLAEVHHYQRLTSLFEQPNETIGCVHSLAELRAACVGDFDTHMSDNQMRLFTRVHTELDWDERRELIDALNDLERLDIDGAASDCFMYHKTCWNRSTGTSVIRLIYRLCCVDEEFQADSYRYSLFCLCDTPSVCVNPQHYIHRAARSQPRVLKRQRQQCQPSSNVDIVEQTCAELTHAKEGAERQRLTAMLACLTDHLALDDVTDGRKSDGDADVCFEGAIEDDRTNVCNEQTPPLTSNTSGAATPIGNNAKRKASDLIVVGGKRKRASTPSPPPAPSSPPPVQTTTTTPHTACKPIAMAYNSRATAWQRLVEIL